MAPPSTIFLFSATLLAVVSQALADKQLFPTAIKKQYPDPNEKILADHLAFAPFLRVGPVHGSSWEARDIDHDVQTNGTSRFYPPFARHFDETEHSVLRRAAEALALLQKRSSCPSGMNSCAQQGSPNKCCQQGTYCTDVPDTDVGHVACCPNGSTCGGGVGKCPSDATSCAAALGGGCCIPGYVCQGLGCVPSAPPTPTTVIQTSASPGVTTKTTNQAVTPSSTSTSTSVTTNTNSATGNPAWRPIGSSETTSAPASTSVTQSGCPTGFYGCLATHGGGCCQTDRECHTYSCPPSPSTTVVSDGATVVVPATNIPKPTGSAKCAGGWFMCGPDAGARAGCCPSGYSCGTASCFTAGATETGKVQKQAPDQSLATKTITRKRSAWIYIAPAIFLLGLI